MSEHPGPATGLWCTSDNEERWSPPGYFDTRDEAIENGRHEWDGDFYVGQCRCLTPELVASYIVPGDWGNLEADVCDGEEMDPDGNKVIGEPTKDQLAELQSLIAEWLSRHKIVVAYFSAENAQLQKQERR